jgi:hypothetical protein
MIPAGALVASGLQPSNEYETQSRQGDLSIEDADETGAVELARAEARIAALEDVVARQDDELRFLRRLLADAVAARRDS